MTDEELDAIEAKFNVSFDSLGDRVVLTPWAEQPVAKLIAEVRRLRSAPMNDGEVSALTTIHRLMGAIETLQAEKLELARLLRNSARRFADEVSG